MARTGPQILRDDLKPGIDRCFIKGAELLESSRLLLDKGKLEAAADLYVLSAQEFGKAGLLADAYATREPKPTVAGFFDHDAKITRATTVLGSSAMWLKTGPFQRDAFQASAFAAGVPADEPTRLEMLYVNYGSTGWLDPPTIDGAELRGHIDDTLRRLHEFKTALLV